MLPPLVDGILSSTFVVCLALAYGLIYGVLGAMDLTVGARFAAAGFAGWLVANRLSGDGNPAWHPVVWLGAVAGAVAVTIPIWSLLRPLSRRAPLVMLVGSLGLASVLQAAYQAFFGATPRVFVGYPAETGLPLLRTTATPLQLLALGYVAAATAVLAFLFHCTSFGKKLRALAADPEVARCVFGLNSDRLTWIAVVASSILLAPAGLLYSIGHGITPTTGSDIGLLAFVATIVAGRQNPLGAVGAALGLMVIATLAIRWTLNETIAAALAVGFVLGARMLFGFARASARSALAGVTVAIVVAVAGVGSLASLIEHAFPGRVALAQMPSAFQPLVPYFVIVCALLVRPTGLFRARHRVV